MSNQTMKNAHQNTKQALNGGLKRLHNAYVDCTALNQLQQKIQHFQSSHQQSQTKLLSFSEQQGLQISSEAQSNFPIAQLQNLRNMLEKYEKAGGQLIEAMIRLRTLPKTQNISHEMVNQSPSLVNHDQPQNNLKQQSMSNSSEENEHLQIDLEDIHLQSDNSQVQEQNIRQKTPSMKAELKGFPRFFPSKEQNSDSNLSAENDRMRRKKYAMSEKLITQLYADLKKPNLNKKQLQKKYSISQSTVNRYIRRLKEKEELPQYLQKRVLKVKPRLNSQSQNHFQPSTNEQSFHHQQKHLSRRKNSKMKLIEPKLLEIYSKYPQIYQSEAASMLSKYYKQQISIHVVSRCLKNISKRKSLSNQIQGKKLVQTYQKMQQNSPMSINNRFYFANEFMSRTLSSIIYIDQGVFKKNGAMSKIQKIHFALALSGMGKIVHWKLKSHSFKANEIASFIEELSNKFQMYTIVMDSAAIHRLDPIKNLLRDKCINHLFLPPNSALLNPIESIFPYFNSEFKKKLTGDLESHQTLRLAHFTIMQIKQKVFAKEIASAGHFIELAFRKEPFPSSGQSSE